MSRAVIGIDPGIGGAIALLVEGEYVDALPMPTERKKSGRNQVDARELCGIMEDYCCRADKTDCIVELVSAMPGQGVSSMFSLGDSFGTARTVAALFGQRVSFVTPAVWKRVAGLTKDKEYSLTLARQAFPLAREALKRKKDEGLAEALLLARYGYRDHKW